MVIHGSGSPGTARPGPRVPRAWLNDPADVRGVYLWAGSATADLLRVKFPDRKVDVRAHLEALSRDSASRLSEAGLNVAFLSFNWGFPPEVESAHHDEFRRAAEAYHAEGFDVLAYVQSSNCVATGSYAARDWWARRPSGRRIPYYRKRFMTCWNDPAWVAEVGERIAGALRAGADGVFLDNAWMGATPWILAGKPGGFAGCACGRCASRYWEATGAMIPPRLRDDRASARYLGWRADVVAERLAGWAEAAAREREDALFVVNDCDAALRDTRALFGLDPCRAAVHQSALLVENIAMPRLDPKGYLVNNALPLRALRILAPERPILALTYEHGIGLDGLPEVDRLRRGVAEAAALGASFVVKGSEYLDREGRFTVVTAEGGGEPLRAVADYLAWIEEHAALFRGTRPAAPIGVLLDREGFRNRWSEVAPSTFALAQALQHESVPWRFVVADETGAGASSLTALVVPPGVEAPEAAEGLPVARLEEGILDIPAPARRLGEEGFPREVAGRLLGGLARAYFRFATVRRLVDSAGLSRRFLRSRFFRVPGGTSKLLYRVPAVRRVRVAADAPVLVEPRLRADGTLVTHLVSYARGSTRVRVPLEGRAPPLVHSPEPVTDAAVVGGELCLTLHTWVVLEWAGTG